MAFVSTSPFTDLAGFLPQTDEERLLFYAELVVANASQLLADLTSPKYTFLSFSEKSRNEVRQKTSLLHSIKQTFTDVAKMYNDANNLEKERQLHNRTREHELLHQKSIENVPNTNIYDSNNNDNNSDDDDDEEEQVSISEQELLNENNTKSKDEKRQSNAIVDETCDSSDDISLVNNNSNNNDEEYEKLLDYNNDVVTRLHQVEQELLSEQSAWEDVSKEVNSVNAEIGKCCKEFEEMSLCVEQLKEYINEVEYTLLNGKMQWHVDCLFQEEEMQRELIVNEEYNIIENTLHEFLQVELQLCEQYLTNVHSNVESVTNELRERRQKHEVELASYQIAYKEEQAKVEEIKDAITALRQQHYALECIAKEQQITESKANSLTRAIRHALSPSQSTQAITISSPNSERSHVPQLSEEMQKEVERDHSQVSMLAARVNAMELQRHEVAAVLVQSKQILEQHVVEFATVEGVVKRIQDILAPGIYLDDDALC